MELGHTVEGRGRLGEKRDHSIRRPRAFPSGSMVRNLPADAGDAGSTPDLGDSNLAHAPQLLKPVCPWAHASQQEKPPREVRESQLESSPAP